MTSEGKPIRVLIVDNSLAMLWGLGKVIQGEFPRMTLIGTGRTDGEAMIHAGLRPHVIVLDLDLDGYSSLEIIPSLIRRSRGRVLVHTGVSDRRLHADAMLFGAGDVITKDCSAGELLAAIDAVHSGRRGRSVPDAALLCDVGRVAAADFDRLSPGELALVAELVERWRLRVPAARRMPPTIAEIAFLYDKLGIANRLELVRATEAQTSRRRAALLPMQ